MPGPNGSQPAEPIGVAPRLTMWQAVRQSWLAHPDWTVAEHLAWLDGEGYDTASVTGEPAELIGRWVAGHRRSVPLSLPADEPRVYVVAGGDMVAVFDDPGSAGAHICVMEAAGITAEAYTLSASKWEHAAPIVRIANPRLVITDTRSGHADGPS
ncbi:hypothetical protein [Micromonospora sp. WMMD1082]|uniref:hypothetical protein n=1 Tax=Micromonospora sp. WMMD1082 TaxID=3016104 RepID=UPI00241663A0|nr:hypothetical protein [Micromonospora sp. WMMD1082]MDG4793520.1 hypothetical protein [Micromonospora sp. WMMD1082]